MGIDVSASDLWSAALAELELQMTRGTFNTWLRSTRAELDGDDTLIITVENDFAKDWLENRLYATIQRTVRGILKRDVEIVFVVGSTPQPFDSASPAQECPSSTVSIEFVEYDPTKRGWVQVSNYAVRFWMPYLGVEAFSLWLALRSFAYHASKVTWPSVRTLAEITASGNRQKVIGRKSGGRWYPGTLEILERERIIWYKRSGSHYKFRVLASLPLLTPEQVQALCPHLQRAHARFIRACELDYAEWEQLPLPTLANLPSQDSPEE